jgi:hypothetical protein
VGENVGNGVGMFVIGKSAEFVGCRVGGADGDDVGFLVGMVGTPVGTAVGKGVGITRT